MIQAGKHPHEKPLRGADAQAISQPADYIARIACHVPFTIQLLYDNEPVLQPLMAGVDPGRTNIGVSVISDHADLVFSGRRVKRGLYRSKNGTEPLVIGVPPAGGPVPVTVNADVNAAGNIIRKEYPYAFDNVKDWSYLTETVLRVTRNDICHSVTKEYRKTPRRGSDLHNIMRREHRETLCMYRYLFRDTAYGKKKPQEQKEPVPAA